MKFLVGVLVASLALSGVLALPARLPSDDAEVINVPRRTGAGAAVPDDYDVEPDFKGFRGIIDTGVGYPFLAQPNPHPFLGFFDSFEDIFRRLHTRLWPVVLSDPSATAGDTDSSEEGLFGFNLNPKNGNTTSTVKVVDGHKIEVNETVYGDANNVFKVRVVNIRPVDSDEEVSGDGDTVAKTDVNTVGNPATSAPPSKTFNRNGAAADAEDDDDDLDERREPLEKKQPTENEIRGNIDDPEHSKHQQQKPEEEQYATMLPTTINEDNAANLNAAFVTDNSIEEVEELVAELETEAEEENQSGNGNIEAETNKPVTDDASDEHETMDNNYDEAAVALGAAKEQQPNEEAVVSSLVENAQLTIENNEEAEEIDNFNESSAEDSTTAVSEQADEEETELLEQEHQLTKELSELALSAEAEVVEAAEEAAAAAVEDFDETVKDDTEAIAEFHSESESDMDDKDDEEEGKKAVVNSSASHSNYAAVNKHREDISSSDDEAEEDGVEMHSEFNSEWANLAEDLASANDQNNDLSNDIEVYDVEPVDLSNDIAVNDVAAAQADFPLNPDAEFINVDDDGESGGDGALLIKPSHSSVPKFEKLSLGVAMNPTTSYHQPSSFSQNIMK